MRPVIEDTVLKVLSWMTGDYAGERELYVYQEDQASVSSGQDDVARVDVTVHQADGFFGDF